MQDRIGVIADIHGNRLALEAVFEDIEKHNINTVFNLGDSLYGPLDPSGTYQLISTKSMISISGNQDRFIVENKTKNDGKNLTLSFVLEALPPEAFNWLRKLDKETIWKNMYMCHGKLGQDDVPLMEKFHDGEVRLRNDSELENELKNINQEIILCAHTHIPRIHRNLESKKYIINPGSVGLPAYDDDLPFYHKMESNSPLAKYVIIDFEGEKITSINQRSLRYDYDRAAKEAKRNGRADWAYWLLNGKAK